MAPGTSRSAHTGATWVGKSLNMEVVLPSKGLIAINGVQGFLLKADIAILFGMAKSLPANGVIVEIGSFTGLSSLIMASGLAAAGNFGARICCVDTWEGSPELQEIDVVKNRRMYEVFLDNINNSGLRSFIRPVRKPSVDAALQFAPHSIDMVFIDGDHTFEGCYSDLDAWLPKLKPSGTMIGHDFYSKGDVQKAVENFTRERGITFNLPNPMHSSIFRIIR